MPDRVKTHHVNRLKELRSYWTSPKGHIDSPEVFHEFEVGQLDRLIEYLQVVDIPGAMPKLHNDFKKFYTQYDVRRNKTFSATFPELEEWYESL